MRHEMSMQCFFSGYPGLISNIDPFPGFRWNAGLSYQF